MNLGRVFAQLISFLPDSLRRVSYFDAATNKRLKIRPDGEPSLY